MSGHSRLPIATLLLTAAALVAGTLPELSQLLQLDWEAAGRGQLWRLWTGHLVHWTVEHLVWDVVTFLALGTLCERADRRVYLAALGLGLPAISGGLALLCPQISVYRGLSGIDTGLFVWLVLLQLTPSGNSRQRGLKLFWGLLLSGLIGKLAYEAVTGSCLFVHTSPGTFQPLVESHLLGAAVGLLAFLGRCCCGSPTAADSAETARVPRQDRLGLKRPPESPASNGVAGMRFASRLMASVRLRRLADRPRIPVSDS